MTSRSRRRGVLLAWLVVAGTPSLAHAQSINEGPTTARTATVTAAEEPPFWVAGVAIASERRSAVLILLDDTRRREVGIVTLREGENYGDYRLAAVEPSGVQLERNGTIFSVPVGRPYAGPRGTLDAALPTARHPIFIPGPDKPTPDVEFVKPEASRRAGQFAPGAGGGIDPDAQSVPISLEQLFGHPQVQQTLEEMRPLMRQRMERARQGGQGPTDIPAPASKPPGGASQ